MSTSSSSSGSSCEWPLDRKHSRQLKHSCGFLLCFCVCVCAYWFALGMMMDELDSDSINNNRARTDCLQLCNASVHNVFLLHNWISTPVFHSNGLFVKGSTKSGLFWKLCLNVSGAPRGRCGDGAIQESIECGSICVCVSLTLASICTYTTVESSDNGMSTDWLELATAMFLPCSLSAPTNQCGRIQQFFISTLPGCPERATRPRAQLAFISRY